MTGFDHGEAIRSRAGTLGRIKQRGLESGKTKVVCYVRESFSN
ncbi:hypothetical protein RSSM_03136 [Rhodopirellula sallentina SM41]|uniref:Uncharacterized protein n=1 Tax=Rhodopirellula sallentina SM41 TaxID=1263870 RepID=M5UC49_9BACT|nr:hypothetical protein RSSM_03136 [Rhodopirellula sallentina SM41]